MITRSGPGDSETWAPCVGHPNDPRTPDCDDDECDGEFCDICFEYFEPGEECPNCHRIETEGSE